MMNLATLKSLEIPEGSVVEIAVGGRVLWTKEAERFTPYVSFGDSIAAGHAINEDWESNYGRGSQYGSNGNESTVIVPGSYTDLIREELSKRYDVPVFAKSFAQSGDRVADLIEKLDQQPVIDALAEAEVVTICIGANDILGPALDSLEGYINHGRPALDALGAEVDANLSALADDANPNSYMALMDKMHSINPNARYIFMNVYNPIKYLWLDEGEGGFFKPVLDSIPQMTILGFEVDDLIRGYLLDTDAVKTLFSRVNGLGDWAEGYIVRLNQILKSKVEAHPSGSFTVADSKSLFESFPDRRVNAPRHYNDLVNIEYTRGYDTSTMSWGELWGGKNVGDYWWDLASEHISNGFDIEGFATELVTDIVNRVIVPDVDPHPEEYGHQVLYRLFADALGWQPLVRYQISYGAGGGSGTMANQEVLGVGEIPAYATLRECEFTPAEGYYFTGWSDGHFVGQVVVLVGNLPLTAQWSNIYTVRYQHTNHTDSLLYPDDSNTGHQECYDLWIDGEQMPDFGVFTNAVTEYRLPYNAHIGVIVSDYTGSGSDALLYDESTCSVYWNGALVASGRGEASYLFRVNSNMTIDFRWKIAGSLLTANAQSWEDCHITTW